MGVSSNPTNSMSAIINRIIDLPSVRRRRRCATATAVV
jgi:hypothetical protein